MPTLVGADIMQDSDKTNYLYKKSLGIANTNNGVAAGLEVFTSPNAVRSRNVFTQTIPDADLSAALTSDATWTTTPASASTRQTATVYPYIAKYTNVPLQSMSQNPGVAFNYAANTALLQGVIMPYKLLVGGVPTTPVYNLDVYNSVGTKISADRYSIDPDAGIILFFGEPTVTASLLPKISFWCYEGARADTYVVTSSVYVSSIGMGALNILDVNGTLRAPSSLLQTLYASSIGVGTSSPQYMLDVKGTIRAPSSLLQTLYASSIGVGTSSPQYMLDVNGSSRVINLFGSTLTIKNQGRTDNLMGNLIIENNNAKALYRFTGNDAGTISYLQVSSLYVTPLSNATPTFMVGTDINCVGIRTPNPLWGLDVKCDSRIFNDTVTTPAILRLGNYYSGQNTTGADVTCGRIEIGNSQYQTTIQTRISTTTWGDECRLDLCTPVGTNDNTQVERVSIMPFTGNVGIGTKMPAYSLDVNGNTRCTNLYTTGSVGVGTTNPAQPLDVAGTIRATNLIVTNGTGATDASIGNLTIANTSGQTLYRFTGNPTDTSLSYIQAASTLHVTPILGGSGSAVLTVGTKGTYANCVGIRTATPGWGLDVKCDSRIFNDTVTTPAILRLGNYYSGQNGGADVTCGRIELGNNSYQAMIQTRIPSSKYADGCRLDLCTPASANDNTQVERISIMPFTGFVGIGTTSPAYPLDVRTYTTSPLINGRDLSEVGPSYYYGTAPVSIHSLYHVWSETRFIASSDQRIKKEIVEIDDYEALADLRKIEPMKYKYIDEVQRGGDQVYGFIAQQVSSFMKSAVFKHTSFIPNLFSSFGVEVIQNVSSQIVSFDLPSETLSTLNVNQRLKLFDAVREHETMISSINQTQVFLEMSGSDIIQPYSSMLFMYGTEVDDFLTLDKDALFTLNFAATQQIDRIQQSSLQTITELQSQISAMGARLDAQESTITALLARL